MDSIFDPRTEPYKGISIVAFLDVLGFSESLQRTWGSENDTLEKILSLKDAIVTSKRLAFNAQGYPKKSLGFSEASVHSDAERIYAFPSFMAMVAKVQVACECASKLGFVLRGGVELGEVYWDGNDAIGPAFLDAYALENKAGSARVLIGPKILRQLKSEIHADSSFNYVTGEVLGRFSDGGFGVILSPRHIDDLKVIQSQSDPKHHWRYDELIKLSSVSNDQRGRLRPVYYERAAAAAEKILRQEKRASSC